MAAGSASPSHLAGAPARPGRAAAPLIRIALACDALALLWVAGSLPAYARAFGVPEATAGFVFTASGLGFVVAVPLAGRLADRWGKHRIAAWSCLGAAVGLLLFALSSDLALGLLAATVAGAGLGCVESTATALLAEMYPGQEGAANLSAQVFFCVGAVLAPFWLLVPGLDWRSRFAGCAVVWMLLAFGFRLQTPSAGTRRESGRGADARPAMPHLPDVAAVIVAMALYTGVEVAVWGWLYAVVSRSAGGAFWGAIELSAFWFAMGLGRWAVGRLCHRWPLPRWISLEAVVGAPALLLVLWAPGGGWALGAAALCGLAFSGIWPSLVGLAQQRHGDSALLTAWLVAAGGAGGLVVPAGFGFLVARAGVVVGAAVLAILLLPVAVLPSVGVRTDAGG